MVVAIASAITTISSNIATDGNLTVNGVTTLGDAAADTITFTGTVQGASPLVFEGATDNAFETIFAITDPTVADKTITFPNSSLTVAGIDLAQAWSSAQTFNGGITAATFSVNPATKDPIEIYPLDGSGADFTGRITSADLSAARTWTFPDSNLSFYNATTAAIDLASAAAGTCVTGTTTAIAQTVALGDTVIVNPSLDDAAWDIGSLTAFVETAGTPGTIKIVYCNNSAGASDPASMTYKVTVLKF